MKTKYYFNGPGGKIEVKPPLVVRLAESSLFLALWVAGFILWGGYYLFLADQEVFLSRSLSSAHKHLQSNCMNCHEPFVGVTNKACSSSGCHGEMEHNVIHNTRDGKCYYCHPEHNEGDLITVGIPDKECADCHNLLEQDPDSIFFPANMKKRQMTYVPRSIFKHSSHQYPPNYRCWQCHCTGGKGTINIPMNELFLMESCMVCHEQQSCHDCHKYHQKREERTRGLKCIKEQFMAELQLKTMKCTPYRKMLPGFENMTICETGEPASEFGKKPPEESSPFFSPAPEKPENNDQ